MNQLVQNNTNRINKLHSEIKNHLRQSLSKAIEVGECISQTKEHLPHGGFTPWINDNLAFSARTARRYQKLYDNRDRLAGANSLSQAYRQLSDGKTDTVSDLKDEISNFEQLIQLGEDIISLQRTHEHPFGGMNKRWIEKVEKYIKQTDTQLEKLTEKSLNERDWTDKLRQLGLIHNQQTQLNNLVVEMKLIAQRKLGELTQTTNE